MSENNAMVVTFTFPTLIFSLVSGLEAFSRNPTDDSFATLVYQPMAFTNYLNQLFLSY